VEAVPAIVVRVGRAVDVHLRPPALKADAVSLS
jgi:hypothetical protein